MSLGEPFARMALAALHRIYPNKLSHVLNGPEDARRPDELTPAFCGCFDWHSAVHGHWTLVRTARLAAATKLAADARAAVAKSFTPERLAGELAYLQAPGHETFEVPYGMAWLLTLCAELREWYDSDARRWQSALAPHEKLAAERLVRFVSKLTHPIRSGEHTQSAFAMGLALDWTRAAGDDATGATLRRQAVRLHAADTGWPLDFEPSGYDFLSPGLGAADLMRRVLGAGDFADWLGQALPDIPSRNDPDWLPAVAAADRTDGKLVHLSGLLLSRAWMLEGIASKLPQDDARLAALDAAAALHRREGLAAAMDTHYAGSHWLGSFAMYLLTRRGLADQTPLQ